MKLRHELCTVGHWHCTIFKEEMKRSFGSESVLGTRCHMFMALVSSSSAVAKFEVSLT
jgi:hypothetical protein